ncbi:MAG: hypothetical protein ACE5KR_00435 [Candidatus Bipolaricaulia bacterium]
MSRSVLFVALLLTILSFSAYTVYADGYSLTDEEIAQVLTESHARWEAKLAALEEKLDLYQLWDEAERLWAITERSVRKLAGQEFPSQEEALRRAHSIADGLIASGISILKELIRREQERRRPVKPPRSLLPGKP